MKLITLTKGQFAKVDDHRYEDLVQWKWAARWNPSTSSYYAQRSIYPGGRKGKTTIQMHREILGFQPRDGKQGDHRNGDTLDNQDHNLRDGSDGRNAKNCKMYSANSAGLKGVYWNKQHQRWRAQIQVDRKKIYLGSFDSKERASEVYLAAAAQHFGEFARAG